jgi:hypothetical protein
VLGDDVSNWASPLALKRVDLDDDPRPAEAGYSFVELGGAERELLSPGEVMLVESFVVDRLDAEVGPFARGRELVVVLAAGREHEHNLLIVKSVEATDDDGHKIVGVVIQCLDDGVTVVTERSQLRGHVHVISIINQSSERQREGERERGTKTSTVKEKLV